MIAAVIWLALGAVCGVLVHAVGLGLRRTRGRGRRVLVASAGLGALAALVGGLIGHLVFGRFFALPTALWVSLLVAAGGPWLVARLRERWAHAAAREKTPANRLP